jgi:hypothetical protein
MTTKPQNQVATREGPKMPDLAEPIALVEKLAKDYSLGALKNKGHLERAIVLARGVREMRVAVEPLMPDVMLLMNDPLGFLTDRDPRKSKDKQVTLYHRDVVRDCLIHSLLKGLYPVGNEWNIISFRQYTTKEGYERLVRELPGITDLDVCEGIPKCSSGGAIVPIRASWRFEGKPMLLRNEKGAPLVEIAVRLNAGMGVDAAIGKALRKLYARIYRKITGTDHAEGDVGDLDFPTLTQEDAGRLLEQARQREPLPPATRPPAGNGNAAPPRPENATQEQLATMSALSRQLQWEESEFLALVAKFGKDRPEELSRENAAELLIEMEDTLRRQNEGQGGE